MKLTLSLIAAALLLTGCGTTGGTWDLTLHRNEEGWSAQSRFHVPSGKEPILSK